MDDDSNSGGELVNINDVFENSSCTMSPESPPTSPEVLTRPSIIVPVVKSKILKYSCSDVLKCKKFLSLKRRMSSWSQTCRRAAMTSSTLSPSEPDWQERRFGNILKKTCLSYLSPFPGGEKEKVRGRTGLCSRGHCSGHSSWYGLRSQDKEL